jgi:hypothetical protein
MEAVLIFNSIIPVYSDMPMWRATKGDHSFIITEEDGVYASSVRRVYTTEPHIVPDQIIYLGEFPSMQQAIEACDRWKP